MDVALVSCLTLPEPDPDAEPLALALAEAGLEASVLAWEDPTVDWSAAPMTVVCSSWNYPLHYRAFLDWAEATAAVTRLFNPLAVVRWNAHKSYLFDLERRGIAVTPTVLVRRGEEVSLSEVMRSRNWATVVVKPAVSAASFRTMRVGRAEMAVGEDHLRALVAERDVLVQEYLPSVEVHGERALVWIDGQLTHAVRKSCRFDGQDEDVSGPVDIAPAEAELATRVMGGVDGALLYGRVDVAPDRNGQPVLMELELIEPSLFFAQGPAALDRYVAAIGRELER